MLFNENEEGIVYSALVFNPYALYSSKKFRNNFLQDHFFAGYVVLAHYRAPHSRFNSDFLHIY